MKKETLNCFKHILSIILVLFSFSKLSALNYHIIDLGEQNYGPEGWEDYILNDQGQVAHLEEGKLKLFEIEKGWKYLTKKPSKKCDSYVHSSIPFRGFTKSGIILGNLYGNNHQPPFFRPFVYYPDKKFVDFKREFSKLGISINYFDIGSFYINEKGLVVGLYRDNDNGPCKMFTYNRNNGIKIIHYPPDLKIGKNFYSIRALNNSGQILIIGNDTFYLYDPSEGFIPLDKFGLGEIITCDHYPICITHNYTLVMNDNGVIAGWICANGGDGLTIFVYNPETGTHIVPIKIGWPCSFSGYPFILTNDNKIILSMGREWDSDNDTKENIHKSYTWSEEEGLKEFFDWEKFQYVDIDEDGHQAYHLPIINSMTVTETGRIQIIGQINYTEGFIWDSVDGFNTLENVIGQANKTYDMSKLKWNCNLFINTRGEILIDNIPGNIFDKDGDPINRAILLVPVK